MDQQQHDPADDPVPVIRHHSEPGPVERPEGEPTGEHRDLDALIEAHHQTLRGFDARARREAYFRVATHPDYAAYVARHRPSEFTD